MLAIGIGATTAIYSLMRFEILKPIEAVVAGTKNEPDLQRTRLFIRIP